MNPVIILPEAEGDLAQAAEFGKMLYIVDVLQF